MIFPITTLLFLYVSVCNVVEESENDIYRILIEFDLSRFFQFACIGLVCGSITMEGNEFERGQNFEREKCEKEKELMRMERELLDREKKLLQWEKEAGWCSLCKKGKKATKRKLEEAESSSDSSESTDSENETNKKKKKKESRCSMV